MNELKEKKNTHTQRRKKNYKCKNIAISLK